MELFVIHQALEGFELQEKTRKPEDKFGSEKVRNERYCVRICEVKRIKTAIRKTRGFTYIATGNEECSQLSNPQNSPSS